MDESSRKTSPPTRRPIRALPPAMVNRIAAGEVIERPASVVKECVENSLDAGATRIEVEIEEGGRSLIRISDDGSGIPAEELPLAFASHATSKLLDDSELFAIRTMGFRGEALASIGSVSIAKIISRTKESLNASEIESRAAQISPVRACAGNVGTVVEVRELFFNVPARRKFLKGVATEAGHVVDVVTKIALARPDVSFRVIHNGRTCLDLPAVQNPEDRLLAAWPDSFATQHLRLSVDEDSISIRGLIGLPELAQPHVRHQHVYVNGRAVRDRFVSHALREAFRGLVEPGRNPAAVLMIELPPEAVDVNVHPTKSEVRFRDSSRVHGLVMRSVRQLLLENDLTPRVRVEADPISPSQEELRRNEWREQFAAFFRQTPEPSPARASENLLQPPADSRLPADSPPVTTASALDQAAAIAAIQLHNTYLVAETDDGLVIIDQHALHERILFEDLLARLSRGPLESQRLLMPIVVEVPSEQVENLDVLRPSLLRLGMDVAPIGPDAVAIHAFPSFLDRFDPGGFLKDVLERVDEQTKTLDAERVLHDLLDMMACKAAVKAGDPLSDVEVKALLARRHLTSRASNCPHGRPTTLRLSLRDLEKQFKRTGF